MKLLEEFKYLLDALKKIGAYVSFMSKIKFDSSLLQKLTALVDSSKYKNDEHSLMPCNSIDRFFFRQLYGFRKRKPPSSKSKCKFRL